MFGVMKLKETLKDPNNTSLIAEIYKLNDCKCYWIRFFNQLSQEEKQFITVRVCAEFKNHNYNNIKDDINQKYFAEALEKLKAKTERGKTIPEIPTIDGV